MFVDAGRVDAGDTEYLTWDELSGLDSDRWQLQLHSGRGHQQIRYGPDPDDYGRERVRSDIEWGHRALAEHISAYRPLAFAPQIRD